MKNWMLLFAVFQTLEAAASRTQSLSQLLSAISQLSSADEKKKEEFAANLKTAFANAPRKDRILLFAKFPALQRQLGESFWEMATSVEGAALADVTNKEVPLAALKAATNASIISKRPEHAVHAMDLALHHRYTEVVEKSSLLLESAVRGTLGGTHDSQAVAQALANKLRRDSYPISHAIGLWLSNEPISQRELRHELKSLLTQGRGYAVRLAATRALERLNGSEDHHLETMSPSVRERVSLKTKAFKDADPEIRLLGLKSFDNEPRGIAGSVVWEALRSKVPKLRQWVLDWESRQPQHDPMLILEAWDVATVTQKKQLLQIMADGRLRAHAPLEERLLQLPLAALDNEQLRPAAVGALLQRNIPESLSLYAEDRAFIKQIESHPTLSESERQRLSLLTSKIRRQLEQIVNSQAVEAAVSRCERQYFGPLLELHFK